MLKKEQFLLSNIKADVVKMLDVVKETSECFNGTSIDSMYLVTKNQLKSLNKIDSLLTSYATLLESVKKTYVAQDVLFGQYLNNNTKKIN